MTRSFDVFFDLRLYIRLSKQSWGWWFETPSRSLWRHCNGHPRSPPSQHKSGRDLASGLLRYVANSVGLQRSGHKLRCETICRLKCNVRIVHYNDVIMGAIASQITSLTVVYSIVYSDADQRKHQSSESLAFVWGIHRGPVNSPHKWPVTRKMFPFDDVIMVRSQHNKASGVWVLFTLKNLMIPFVVTLFGSMALTASSTTITRKSLKRSRQIFLTVATKFCGLVLLERLLNFIPQSFTLSRFFLMNKSVLLLILSLQLWKRCRHANAMPW